MINSLKDLAIGQYSFIMVSIQIKNLINQEIFYININLTSSVFDLKKEIESQQENISASGIRLVFSGHLLNDFFSLYSQGVKNDSIIYLIGGEYNKNSSNSFDIENESIYRSTSFLLKPNIHVLQLKPFFSCIKSIRIRLNSQISTLDKAFSVDSKYIFKGEVLDKEQTFEYYSIISGDSIVSIQCEYTEENSNLIEKWIKRTNDYETYQKFIDSNVKTNCQNENAKRIDIRYHKIELNKKRYYKMFNENRIEKDYLPSASKKDGIKLNINYQKPSSPSTNKLPFFIRYPD